MARSMTGSGKKARLCACALATLFAVPALVQGQMQESIVVQIPYSFTIPVSKTPLPAGTYTISMSKTDNLIALVSSTGVTTKQMIITRLGGPNPFLQEGSLVFDSTGGNHMLSEIWMPDGAAALVYSVPKGHTRGFLSFSDLPSTGQVSGKLAYDRTCARCHGQGGNGNPSADRYMGVAIPKLNSEQVQSKSDAELKAIISSGTKDMPPVEIEQSGFLHRLPPQDVSAVIAYVRTLKQ